MFQNIQIVYRHKSIQKISDIETFNHGTFLIPKRPLESACPKLKCLSQYENILLQRKVCELPRRYTCDDMVKMQACLENLDFLEALKFSGYATNARKLLQKYLYSHYDFLSCDLLSDRKDLCVKNILHSTDVIGSNIETLSFDDMKDSESPPKSIRTHFNNFLANQINYRHIQCSCNTSIEPCTFETTSANINNISNERFYLSVYQIPEFLLLFTFFDGRDFDHCFSQFNSNKLPPHKESRRFSEFSYQVVLKKFQEYISKSDNICPLTLSTIFRCDSIFLFYKLNFLLDYYNLYLSDYFLDTLIRRFNLSYRKIIGLQETIVNNIFKDENFIIAGLKSNYLDFMLPFDIFYQFAIFDPIPWAFQEYQQFEDALSDIKKRVQNIWKAGFYWQADFSFLEDGDFSITSNENILIKHITKNPFYQYYFRKENEFIKNLESGSNNNFLCFDSIKKFLNMSFF